MGKPISAPEREREIERERAHTHKAEPGLLSQWLLAERGYSLIHTYKQKAKRPQIRPFDYTILPWKRMHSCEQTDQPIDRSTVAPSKAHTKGHEHPLQTVKITNCFK